MPMCFALGDVGVEFFDVVLYFLLDFSFCSRSTQYFIVSYKTAPEREQLYIQTPLGMSWKLQKVAFLSCSLYFLQQMINNKRNCMNSPGCTFKVECFFNRAARTSFSVFFRVENCRLF